MKHLAVSSVVLIHHVVSIIVHNNGRNHIDIFIDTIFNNIVHDVDVDDIVRILFVDRHRY